VSGWEGPPQDGARDKATATARVRTQGGERCVHPGSVARPGHYCPGTRALTRERPPCGCPQLPPSPCPMCHPHGDQPRTLAQPAPNSSWAAWLAIGALSLAESIACVVGRAPALKTEAQNAQRAYF